MPLAQAEPVSVDAERAELQAVLASPRFAKVFTGITPDKDGQLHLSFSSARGGSAMLSAIEILPGLRAGQRPVRISMRDIPYYSNDSRWWGPDNYFKGGQLGSTEEPAIDADDPEMYEAERWGHFSYAIPVVPGRYAVTFYFIEHRFDAANRDRYGEAPGVNHEMAAASSASSAMARRSCVM